MAHPRDPGPWDENTGDFRKNLDPWDLWTNPGSWNFLKNPENPGFGIENLSGSQKSRKFRSKVLKMSFFQKFWVQIFMTEWSTCLSTPSFLNPYCLLMNWLFRLMKTAKNLMNFQGVGFAPWLYKTVNKIMSICLPFSNKHRSFKFIFSIRKLKVV